MIEVAPDVYRLGDRLVNWWLVVEDDRACVIDGGLPGHLPQLHDALRALGLSVGSIAAVLATHGHIDHLSCASILQREEGTPVHVPAGDVELATRRPRMEPRVLLASWRPSAIASGVAYARQGVLRARPVVAPELIHAGATFDDLPGRPRYLHAPGHTQGGMFALDDRGVLFSGDVLVTLDPFTGRTGPRTLAAFDNVDHRCAVASLELVATTEATTILPGHGEPWSGDAAEAAAIARRASS